MSFWPTGKEPDWWPPATDYEIQIVCADPAHQIAKIVPFGRHPKGWRIELPYWPKGKPTGAGRRTNAVLDIIADASTWLVDDQPSNPDDGGDGRWRYPLECGRCRARVVVTHEKLTPILDAFAGHGAHELTLTALAASLNLSS